MVWDGPGSFQRHRQTSQTGHWPASWNLFTHQRWLRRARNESRPNKIEVPGCLQRARKRAPLLLWNINTPATSKWGAERTGWAPICVSLCLSCGKTTGFPKASLFPRPLNSPGGCELSKGTDSLIKPTGPQSFAHSRCLVNYAYGVILSKTELLKYYTYHLNKTGI